MERVNKRRREEKLRRKGKKIRERKDEKRRGKKIRGAGTKYC